MKPDGSLAEEEENEAEETNELVGTGECQPFIRGKQYLAPVREGKPTPTKQEKEPTTTDHCNNSRRD